MNRFMKAGLRAALVSTTVLGGTVMMVAPAAAQTTTASVRGQVTGADGAPVSGASVTAVNTGTNQTFRATTDANGSYSLNGLRPASYDVTVTGADGIEAKQRVSVGIGQSASLNVTLGAAVADSGTAASGDDIIVTAASLVETKTSEVATNVSLQQIRSLPQTDRNFLSFAALAPGVKYNDSETDKGFSSGASTASQVNVFIDGVSLKNKLREGGVAGQQNSRGNPFGQIAVQEFRVLTQNYKAEYEQAGAAIITAVTKSGTNDFHGEVFGQYTDKGLSQKGYIDTRRGNVEPAFKRQQYGVALGGPIIKDKLFFFFAYEGNDQDRAKNVFGGTNTAARAEFEAATGRRLSEFEGPYVSPFRGDFYFGKLTLTPDEHQVFDLSYSRRQESDIQGFGDSIAYSAAENKINLVETYLFKWTYTGESFINEFNANYLNYNFNPTSLNPDLPQFEYVGVLSFGGKDSTRDERQQGYTIRDDFTYSGLDGHTFKVGARVEVTDIEYDNQAYIQPHYTFTRDIGYSFPSEARLGLGNSLIQSSNTQVGLYLQDDWDVTDRLQLNLGLRWDYETNGFNNDYVTPSGAAAALRALPSTYYFNPENYITDGKDRSPFKGAFAPRFGFSWDIKDDQSTVIFGGIGRYYDRNNFNNTVDEISRRVNPIGVFRFSADGLPRNNLPTVMWNPSYLTRQGLIDLRNTSTSGLPELFAVKNDAKPPVNDQVSLGVRQKFGQWQASLTASYIRGRNGYTNLFATRNNNGYGTCCNTAPVIPFGYSNVLIGYDGLDTRYKALYFTLDKNYTKSSGWGFNLAYTLSKGEQNGNDLFSLDGLTPDNYGWRPKKDDERHRLVLSSIVDLPLGFQFSTLSTFGSGSAYLATDATNGFGPGQLRQTSAYPEKNCIKGVFAFCEVNLTLENRQKLFGNHEVSFAVDLLNAFNNKNFKDFDGFFSNNPLSFDPLDPADAQHAGNTLTLPRRIQFRAGYRF
ncbi:TonB-dependent receptor [Sphingomonas sp.]|uniref:TonB-dependent receptor n=1 Tax=Sphingomonas sp. TaxID=28214 RepID=UPI003D6D30A2